MLIRVDTQGLLDRVFPLDNVVRNKGSSSPSSSKTLADSSSLRMLLKESGDHPLRVYRVCSVLHYHVFYLLMPFLVRSQAAAPDFVSAPFSAITSSGSTVAILSTRSVDD